VSTVQPIAGVHADGESDLETIYPSVAALPLGRWIGRVMEHPAHIQNTPLRLTCLTLLGLPMTPLSLLAYGLGKLTGRCYVITNRRIYSRPMIGNRRLQEVPVFEIDHMEMTTLPGEPFFHAGELLIRNADGNLLMQMSGIPTPDRVRHLIQTLRDSRRQSQAVLDQIEARQQPVPTQTQG